MKLVLNTLLLSILLTSCFGKGVKGTNALSVVDSLNTDSVILQTEESNHAGAVDINAIKPYLEKEKQMRETLIQLLKRSTPAQADSIYREGKYDFKQTAEFDSLVQKTIMLEPHGEKYSDSPSPNDLIVLKMLAESGCFCEDIGEGYFEVNVEQYYYYNLFKPYLSVEVEKFARLRADNNTLFIADAQLCIPLDTLYQRCLKWEEYLKEYPQSRFRPKVSEEYKTYMENLLFCKFDNSSTFYYFDYDKNEPGKINNYCLEAICPLGKIGSGTNTNNIILKYLSELGELDYYYSEEFEKQIMEMVNWIDNKE